MSPDHLPGRPCYYALADPMPRGIEFQTAPMTDRGWWLVVRCDPNRRSQFPSLKMTLAHSLQRRRVTQPVIHPSTQ